MADWQDMERRVRDRIGDALLNARTDKGEYYNLRKIADDTADEITRWWADFQDDEVTKLRTELAEANGKVELLMYGDAHMQSRIWLNEECARLKGERDEAYVTIRALVGQPGEATS